jgi:hypothetical protein
MLLQSPASGPDESKTVSSSLSDLLRATDLTNLLDRVYDARIQTYTGFVPAPGEPEGFNDRGEPHTKNGSYSEDPDEEEDRHAGNVSLINALEKLRIKMHAIGRAVALDPAYGPKTQINEDTFYKLFGELDRGLWEEPAARYGFQKGIESFSRG